MMSYNALLATTPAQTGNVAAFNPRGLSPETLGDGSYARFNDKAPAPVTKGDSDEFNDKASRFAAIAVSIIAIAMIIVSVLHGTGVFDTDTTAAPKPAPADKAPTEMLEDPEVMSHYSLYQSYQERTPQMPPRPPMSGYSQSATPELGEPFGNPVDFRQGVIAEALRALAPNAPMPEPSVWDMPSRTPMPVTPREMLEESLESPGTR